MNLTILWVWIIFYNWFRGKWKREKLGWILFRGYGVIKFKVRFGIINKFWGEKNGEVKFYGGKLFVYSLGMWIIK